MLSESGSNLLHFLDCECYVAGSSLQSGKPICNLSNGVCSCISGYIGDDCNQCDTNYYNSNSSDANKPICEGMFSFPPILKYIS